MLRFSCLVRDGVRFKNAEMRSRKTVNLLWNSMELFTVIKEYSKKFSAVTHLITVFLTVNILITATA